MALIRQSHDHEDAIGDASSDDDVVITEPKWLDDDPAASSSPSQRRVKKRRPPRYQQPAETGRPETSREFAKRIRRVVLHGPRAERQEGGKESPSSSTNTLEPSGPQADQTLQEDEGCQDTVQAELNLGTYLSELSDGIDLLQALKDRYSEDTFFKNVLEKP